MALTRTTADEVRAVLGVSDEELEDLTLDLKVFTDQLELELSDIDATLPWTLDTILAIPSVSRTAAQAKVFTIANLFSAYAYGKILLTSLPLFSPKRMTDGRAEFERFADPFETVRNGVNAGYVSLRARLQTALTTLNGYAAPAAITPIFSVSIGLAVDPVTGV
jgi:hypothetical protein